MSLASANVKAAYAQVHGVKPGRAMLRRHLRQKKLEAYGTIPHDKRAPAVVAKADADQAQHDREMGDGDVQQGSAVDSAAAAAPAGDAGSASSAEHAGNGSGGQHAGPSAATDAEPGDASPDGQAPDSEPRGRSEAGSDQPAGAPASDGASPASSAADADAGKKAKLRADVLKPKKAKGKRKN